MLTAVCLLGAVMPIQGPLSLAETEPPAQELRLATWNLHWLSAEEDQGMIRRSAEDYALLRRYAVHMDADVVALQEVQGVAAASRVFDPQIYAFHFTDDAGNRQNTGFAWRRRLEVHPQADVAALAIGRTRRGADILVRWQGREIRLLAVHLKSGCWQEELTSSRKACDVLRRQLPVLESWIDARAAEGVPFAVLGDFNRRFLPADTFWPEIDDSEPAEADLHAVTRQRTSECWNGQWPDYIDHIVLSRSARQWLVPGSFRQWVYAPEDAPRRRVLSDHCPVSISLQRAGEAPRQKE